MSTLLLNENGTFLNPTFLAFLEHIKLENNTELISSISDGSNPCELSDNTGKTLLHFAAEYGNSKFAQHLVNSGAKVDAQDSKKQTPLMLAVDAGHLEAVLVLLEAKADIFLPDSEGQCALEKAFNNGKYDKKNIFGHMLSRRVTAKYLKESMHVKSQRFHSNVPLYPFMWLRNAEITKILLESGSLVNSKTRVAGDTALHRATSYFDLNNVKLLLEYNADVNAKAHDAKTPLGVIRYWRSGSEHEVLEVVKILLDAGAILIDYKSRVNMVRLLLVRGTREIVRTILKCEIDLLFEDEKGLTSLHYLAKNRCVDILEELPNLDFDINIRCREGRTMLHYAIRASNASSVKFLLDRGADVKAKDLQQRTPLFAATDPKLHESCNFICAPPDDLINCVNCVEILLEHDADPCILTEENRGWYNVSQFDISDQLLIIITPVLAKLAVLEASGRPVEAFMYSQIESYPTVKNRYNSIKIQLEEMKRIEIGHLITLFDFMITNKISPFTRNESSVFSLTEIMKKFSTASCFHRMLHQRFLKFSQLVESRELLLSVINEVLIEFCSLSLYNIAEQIVDYLQDEQWGEIL